MGDMRRVLFFVLFVGLGSVSPVVGQESDPPQDEVLIGGIQHNGGYGAPTVALTSFKGDPVVLVGGQGGWIINRRFVIGGGGRGIATRYGTTLNGRRVDFEMGYGGILFEYIGAPSRLLHYGGELLIGGGDARYFEESTGTSDGDDSIASTSIFASELGGRLELNVTTFFRVGLSGGYRLIVGSDLQGLSDTDLGGPYGQLSFRFGSF